MTAIRRALFTIIGILLIVWLGTTTWFRVQEHEEALVLTMGRATRQVEKGIHGKLPWPFEEVHVLPVRITQQLQFGFRENGGPIQLIADEAMMITGDENLVWADLIVEWRVSDIKKYLFHSDQPQEILRDATSAALRSVIGTTVLDVAITTGKFEIQAEVEKQLIDLMNYYDLGIAVTSVKLQDIEPPAEVQPEFKAVTDAREARATKINEAEKYRNDRTPRARGEAQQLIERAEARKTERINSALGDIANYNAALAAYQANPQVTEKRLILETLEAILPGAEITIVDTTSEGTVRYLPIQPRRGE